MVTNSQLKTQTKKKSSRVALLTKKTNAISRGYSEKMKDGEKMLSFNKVTGYSVNFPISETCLPSEVCASRCYFAMGPATWPNAIKKQLRMYNSVLDNPIQMAERLAKEIQRKQEKITFLRWNGGGDLFKESIIMIHRLAELLPDLPLWVVTRNSRFAAMLEEKPNIFIHFSLDMKSMNRLEQYEKKNKRSQNYFYSYQCDKNEELQLENLEKVSVLFYDCYRPEESLPLIDKSVVCPLNLEDDITGVCERCRRCFDNSAVEHRGSL